MFVLDELIVKSSDDIGTLIEDRASLFIDRFKLLPDTIFISAETYCRYLKLLYNFPIDTPPFGFQQCLYQSPFGTIRFKVIDTVKCFLMVGIESTFADFDYQHGIPRELWSDSSRRKIDEDFEKIVLES